MSSIDVEKLLKKISEKMPSGADLEYDPALQVLEQAAITKPVKEFGDTVVLAEEPDWDKVKMLAVGVLSRTKDLHVAATYLAHALVHSDGFLGCRQALTLVLGYIEQYWDTVHPQLDSEDGFDPISRVNAISALSDSRSIIQSLRRAPLVSVQGFGSFSLRDMDIVAGRITVLKEDESTPPTQAFIDGALMDSSLEALRNTATEIDESLITLKKIKTLLTGLVGMEATPELKELSTELTQAQNVLKKELSRRGALEIESENNMSDNEGEKVKVRTESRSINEVNSRNDVIQVLDKVCAYYSRNEPSSPVPLLLQRTKKLVSMDFMAIVKELASEGVPQAENVMGVDKNENKS